MENQNENQFNKLTEKEVIKKLVPLYRDMEDLNLDIKSILAEAKESDLDSSLLAKVAKAMATNKLEEIEGKAQQLLEFISDVK